MNSLVDEAKLMMQPAPPVAEEVTYNIAASAELMTNFCQSDILQPQKKFQALQTDAGLGLLFMIGTEEDFNVVVEESGKTMHGWTVRNLSEKLIKQSFPKGGTVSIFGVSQVAGKGTSREIHVAMCVEAEGTSNLYLSLHNSDMDLSWTEDIPWLHAPFNAMDSSGKPVPVPQPLSIANIMLTQASDGEHIVVDILRTQEAARPLLERYWIDVSKSQPLWKKHQMAADWEASTYQSTLGRASGDFADGIYTMGQVNRVAQLVYAPLYGFDPLVPPPVSRLRLPEDLVPDAIAAARHSNGDNDSDLYVASHGGLYYFAASNQGNDAVATKVVSEPSLLAGVKRLFAAEEKGVVTVWGLNGSNQVFYLTCKTDEVADSDAWSVPLPVLTSVDAISAYVDRKFLANTFFAHTGTSLRKYIKTPGTGLWTSKSITLPPTSYKQDSRSIQSFTTEIKVTNQTTGMTAANVAVELTSSTVTSVGPEPVTVQTDQDGTITIVELTNSLVATRFHVAIATKMLGMGGVPLQVHPMHAAFKRNSALNSKDKLRDAKVTDMHGNQKPWIPPDTPDDTLDQIAKLNVNLDEASKDVGNSLPLAPRRLAHTRSTAKPKVSGIDLDLSSAATVDIGDLFNALASASQVTIKVVKDEMSGAWHLLAIIEGKIYAALMDTLEAIGGAIPWVYNQIKMAIEWVIMFLELLFNWQDILVTHRVIKKFILLTASEFIDDLASARAATKKALDDFKKNIAEFTGVKQGLKTTSAEALKTLDPSAKHGAPGNLGKHHFKGNVTRASTPKKVDLEGVPSALQSLVELCESAEESVQGAAQRLKKEVLEEFSHLDLTTVMERIAGIISIALVDGTEGMILELFTVCETFVGQLMGMLDHTIDIPVISWLYKLLTGEDLSLLDLACLIAAIPTNVYYKVLMGHAPFSTSDACTQRMLNAKTVRDWNNAPYDQQPLEGALRDDQKKQKAKQALLLGAGAMLGSVIRLSCGWIRREMKNWPMFSDNAVKLMESFRWVGSMLASAPSLNVNMFDKVPDTKEWYVGMGKVLTAWGKVRGFVRIFYVTSENKMIGKAFATLSSTENLLKLIPHIVTPIEEENDWSLPIVFKTLGKVSNDCGGMLSLPQQLTPSPVKEELFLMECVFRLNYGDMMIKYPCMWLAGY